LLFLRAKIKVSRAFPTGPEKGHRSGRGSAGGQRGGGGGWGGSGGQRGESAVRMNGRNGWKRRGTGRVRRGGGGGKNKRDRSTG